MFIYNVKLNGTKIFKGIFAIVCAIVLILFLLATFKVFNKSDNEMKVSDLVAKDVNTIDSKNYTNVLKAVHDNLNEYVGMKIKFTGYVYRVYDLDKDEFVLARDMVISSNYQTLVVGFLCNYEKAENLKDGTWVEIVGEIEKGDYHGEIPVLKILQLKEIKKPSDEYVYPPDDAYVPTSSIL